LAKRPDAAPAATTTDLDFVGDPDYRQPLRTDISAAFSAERNGEGKASTVLTEALLLLVLQSVAPARVQGHALAAQRSGFGIDPSEPLDRWGLGQYIEVASRCAINPN